ncbi:MAG: hypothetical protein NUW22_12705 [Acidobacteria bacterium]|nr:hypothetical protein [Acidobacteriota bacterium]
MIGWWSSIHWRHYERICQVPISRVDELANASWQTRVVDLKQDKTALWRDLRKSYKALIHQAERAYDIHVCEPEDMEAFRQLHRQEAGRETRPKASWDLMAEWVRDGHVILIGGSVNAAHAAGLSAGSTPAPSTTFVGFAAFVVWQGGSYYGWAASVVPNLNHALVWRGMLETKARGAAVCEIGWQGHARDIKGQQIEYFRRGFGGRDLDANETIERGDLCRR